MLRTCLPALLFLLALTPAWAGHAPTKIFLAVYVQTPSGEGMPASLARPIQIPPDGETIMIRSMPDITEHNLIDAQQDPEGSLRLRFDHIGQVNLSAITGQNQERILVVTLNGIVIFAPLIDQQITDGELIIPHHFDPRVVQLLQQVAQGNVRASERH